MIRSAITAALACSLACSKNDGGATAHAGANVDTAGTASSRSGEPIAREAVSDAAADAIATAGKPLHWRGTYTSVAATLQIPPEWKGVHWTVPATPAGLGDGTIDLSLDPGTGRVEGLVDGPLGPARLSGYATPGSAGEVTATIVRTDPSDRGFTGTLAGTRDATHLDGTLNVALAEAEAIRKATFSLLPSASPGDAH